MNRYTNYTPSTYSPLSMNEIMVTPLAMRKQHDDLLAKQELIRSGLAKVDPHDKYYEEAVKLKKDLESEIDTNAKRLSEEGFNNNITAQTISLNRKYNDLISPTGKIGQINAHKQQVAQTIKDYEDDAIKNKWTEAETKKYINQALQNHMNETPWDDKGRIAKFKIDKKAPMRYDYHKEFGDLAKSAGMTTSEFANATSQLLGPDASGYNAQLSKSYASKHGKNSEQLNAALNTFINRLNDPNDSMYKSMDYEGLNKNRLLETLGIQKGVYKNDVKSTESSYKIDHFGSGPESSEKDGSTATAITDPTSTKTIGGKDSDLDFSRIGTIPTKTPLVPPRNLTSLTPKEQQDYYNESKKVGKKQTYKDIISDPLIRQMYENSYNKLVKDGKIHKSRSINDNLSAKAIQNYMNNVMPPVTLSNKVIRADINPSSDMFMGAMVGKDANSRNSTIQQDLDAGLRTMINPETNRPMSVSEFKEKGWKVEYIGYDSPLNFRGYKFLDPKQQVMAHKAIVKDKDGNIIGNTAISRSNEEKMAPEFKAASLLTFSYRNAVLNSGEWTQLGTKESPSKNLKGTQIKYNYDGSIDIKTPNGKIYENQPTESLSQYIFNNYQ